MPAFVNTEIGVWANATAVQLYELRVDENMYVYECWAIWFTWEMTRTSDFRFQNKERDGEAIGERASVNKMEITTNIEWSLWIFKRDVPRPMIHSGALHDMCRYNYIRRSAQNRTASEFALPIEIP